MKKQLKKATVGVLVLTATNAFANSSKRYSLKTEVIDSMAKNLDDAKIQSLFDKNIFEMEENNARVLVDEVALEKESLSGDDAHLVEFAKNLKNLFGDKTQVKIVKSKDMIVATQDRNM